MMLLRCLYCELWTNFAPFSSVSITTLNIYLFAAVDLIYANAIYHGNIAEAYLESSETLMMELFL